MSNSSATLDEKLLAYCLQENKLTIPLISIVTLLFFTLLRSIQFIENTVFTFFYSAIQPEFSLPSVVLASIITISLGMVGNRVFRNPDQIQTTIITPYQLHTFTKYVYENFAVVVGIYLVSLLFYGQELSLLVSSIFVPFTVLLPQLLLVFGILFGFIASIVFNINILQQASEYCENYLPQHEKSVKVTRQDLQSKIVEAYYQDKQLVWMMSGVVTITISVLVIMLTSPPLVGGFGVGLIGLSIITLATTVFFCNKYTVRFKQYSNLAVNVSLSGLIVGSIDTIIMNKTVATLLIISQGVIPDFATYTFERAVTFLWYDSTLWFGVIVGLTVLLTGYNLLVLATTLNLYKNK